MNVTPTNSNCLRRIGACVLPIAVLGAIFVFSDSNTSAEDVKVPVHVQMADANNHFGFDAYEQLSKQHTGDNVFFSPYSISAALMMAASGAVDETAEEMQKVLCLPQPVSEMHPAMALLNTRLQGVDPSTAEELRKQVAGLQQQLKAVKAELKTAGFAESRQLRATEQDLVKKLNAASSQIDQYELKIANSIWGDKSYPFNPDFVSQLNGQYDTGGMFSVDFLRNADAARLRINRWVEDQTNNRIKELLAKGTVNNTTRMVLVNAVYFKGDWAVPFNKKHTQEKAFYLTGGTTTQVPLMSVKANKEARYAAFNADGSAYSTPRKIGMDQTDGLYPEPGGFRVAELPYKGGTVSMVLIAPDRKDGLPQIESMLNAESFASWTSHLQKRPTDITMPKFRLETSYNLGVGGAIPQGLLPDLGMPRAFTSPDRPKGAQLDHMTVSRDPADKLCFGAAVHKAFLEVDEQGTEAAAATALVLMRATSVARTKTFVPSFVADRPFLAIIRDRETGAILFMGRIENPEQS